MLPDPKKRTKTYRFRLHGIDGDRRQGHEAGTDGDRDRGGIDRDRRQGQTGTGTGGHASRPADRTVTLKGLAAYRCVRRTPKSRGGWDLGGEGGRPGTMHEQ